MQNILNTQNSVQSKTGGKLGAEKLMEEQMQKQRYATYCKDLCYKAQHELPSI